MTNCLNEVVALLGNEKTIDNIACPGKQFEVDEERRMLQDMINLLREEEQTATSVEKKYKNQAAFGAIGK